MRSYWFILGFFFFGTAVAQKLPTGITDLSLALDSSLSYWSKDRLAFQGEMQWTLPVSGERQQMRLNISGPKAHALLLESSRNIQVLDSSFAEESKTYLLNFERLLSEDFHRLPLRMGEQSFSLPLLFHTEQSFQLDLREETLYQGEEKRIEVLSNRLPNLILSQEWQEQEDFSFRFSEEGSRVYLHIIGEKKGRHSWTYTPRLRRPIIEQGKAKFVLATFSFDFVVKEGRLAFLDLKQNDLSYEPGQRQEIEVELKDHRFLRMGKTYRLEAQEAPGGALIAELYTKAKLNNDRVLCLLRPYDFHRQAQGLLYIKDGDDARFVTNFDLRAKTQLKQIFLQREGKDWQASREVYPGEVLNVKLTGNSLDRGDLSFFGAAILEGDSSFRSEEQAIFRVQVPLDINTPNIEIFRDGQPLGQSLKVKEYHRPRPFDWIDLVMGAQRYDLEKIDRPIYYYQTMPDLVMLFEEQKIDRPGEMYGVQQLDIKVKISNKKGSVMELYEFENLRICPGSRSPRADKYGPTAKCQGNDLNLNEFISNITSNLPEWAAIDLEFRHHEEAYSEPGYTKKVKIYLARKINYDIDVSFPAGLLILKAGENDFSNFGGISFAMMAQMSFYHPRKIAKYRPFKIGAGFIALDAFNFSANSQNRDLGLVILGSLYPTSSENRLSFPLFAGYGYLLQQRKTFFLIGPGIRVRL